MENAEDVSSDAGATDGSEPAAAPTDSDNAWRDELSARLNRYRTRRKAPPPRYPSLRLPFGAVDSVNRASSVTQSASDCGFESVANRALALDSSVIPDMPGQGEESAEVETHPVAVPQARAGAKIIEFPGFSWGPPSPPPDQLAEPVFDRPRILEVPEVAPPPPALGGITIEPVQQERMEKRLGIDIPLQSAPLGLRIAASVVDGLVIGAAAILFGFIFWKVAAVRPTRIQTMGLAAGVPALFWAAYQYLLIVYAANTPGLSLTGLKLARFDGTATSRSLRRWRVLAAWLSAVSLGMGYLWLFLDEDVLCWHDRITHTYLAPRTATRDQRR